MGGEITRDSELGQGGQNAPLEMDEVEAFVHQWEAALWSITVKPHFSIISLEELKLPLWGIVLLNLSDYNNWIL